MVETGIFVGIADVGGAFSHDRAAYYAAASIETEYVGAAQGNLRPQFVAFAIQKKMNNYGQ